MIAVGSILLTLLDFVGFLGNIVATRFFLDASMDARNVSRLIMHLAWSQLAGWVD